MLKPFAAFLSIVLIVFLALGCEQDDEKEYSNVTTREVTNIKATQATLNGELSIGLNDSIVDHGFLWTSEPGIKEGIGQIISLGVTGSSGAFSAVVTGQFEENHNYYVRAYITRRRNNGDRLILGEELIFQNLGKHAPVVKQILPVNADMGDTIKIIGENFDHENLQPVVELSGVTAKVVESADDAIYVIVPDSLQNVESPVKVSIAGNVSISEDNFILNAPVIDSFSPVTGITGTEITVHGNNFLLNHSRIMIGDDSLVSKHATTKSLTSILQSYVDGGEQSVSVKGPNGLTTVDQKFHFDKSIGITQVTPQLVSFSDTIKIKGQNFPTSNETKIQVVDENGQSFDAHILSKTSTLLRFFLPSAIVSAQQNVKLITGNNEYNAPTTIQLKAPVITSLSPNIGVAGGRITINATNLSGIASNTRVLVNSQAVSLLSLTGQRVVAETPQLSPGTVDVAVEVAGQLSNTIPFTVIAEGAGDFNPKKGTLGTVITLTGIQVPENATDVSVTIGDYRCNVLSVTSTEIQAEIIDEPIETSGSVMLSVDGTQVALPGQFNFVWTKVPHVFPGEPRRSPVSISYNNKGYLLFSEDGFEGTYDDFWSFDSRTGWEQLPSIPAEDLKLLYSPSPVIIDGKMALVTSKYPSGSNIWRYTFETQVWELYESLEVSNFFDAVFTSEGKIYMGLGDSWSDAFTSSFYEYDPVTKTIQKIPAFPAPARRGVLCFEAGNSIVVGLGQKKRLPGLIYDLHKFNPADKTWIPLNNVTSFAGVINTKTFKIGETVYAVGGEGFDVLSNEVHAYDHGNDQWTKKTSYPYPASNLATFVIDGKAYVGLAGNKELWEYHPELDE